MKEKKRNRKVEDSACFAAMSWVFFLMTLSIGLFVVVSKIINWVQFFWVYGIILPVMLGLAISYTYDVFKYKKEKNKC